MFSVTQNGKELDKSKYKWDEENKVFSTKENNLVLDFSNYIEVIFNTGSHCTFKTGYSCTFNTGINCTFNTGYHCTFNTGSYCTFNTGYSCTFITGDNCTFTTGENCVAIRYDIKGITEIPKDITIKLNNYGVSGYTTVQEDKPNPCNGKVVEIDGQKYKLQEIS
jgi:hypothetical protein